MEYKESTEDKILAFAVCVMLGTLAAVFLVHCLAR